MHKGFCCFRNILRTCLKNTEGEIVLLMMGVPGGLGSECPVGAAGWWLQHSEPPAHETAAPRRCSSGSSLHSDTIRVNTQPHKNSI